MPGPSPDPSRTSKPSPSAPGAAQVLTLQRRAGNHAVAGWLRQRTAQVQRLAGAGAVPTVQREDEETLKLEAAELTSVPSGPGGSIRLSDPLHDAAHPDEKPNLASLQIAGTALRAKAEGQRKGFDSQAEALAFAVTRAGGCGAGVVKRGRFFFVVTFVPQPDFTRQKVYGYTTAQGILAAVGNDGFVFDPTVTRYQPDTALKKAEDLTRLQNDPAKSMPGTASAADLARMAGVPPPGAKEGDAASTVAQQGAVEIGPDQVEAFIRQYLVARGMAMLNANEAAAQKLIADFKPTSPGDEKTPGTGVSSNAKTMIDNAREVAADLAKVQDQEIALEKLMSDRDWERSISGTSEAKWTAQGVTKTLREWKTDLAARQKDITRRKDDIFAQNAVVAQLLSKREPDTGLGTDVKRVMDSPVMWGVPLVKLGWEAYKKISPDNTATAGPLKTGTDEEIRAQMQTKLDAVIKAVREVKARTLSGDLAFLVSMSRLYEAAKADFSRIKTRNTMLGHDLETVRVQAGSKFDVTSAVEIAGTVLQLAGFFFPPAEFLGAVMTFGAAASRLGEAMNEKTVADAAVRPDQAMLDPDKAQKKLSEAALGLAMESVNLGVSLGGAAKAIEAGRVPTELKAAKSATEGVSDLMGLASVEREVQVAASLDKVGEAMTVRQAGGHATVRAALPPTSPSMKRINTWQNGVVAQMTQAVGEHQLAKVAGADVGAAGLKPPGSGLPPAPAKSAAPLPAIPALDAKDVEVAKATVAKAVGGKPEEAAKVVGLNLDDPAALQRYMEVSPPPVLSPDELRRALAHHGGLPPTVEGMGHLEPAAMKEYLDKMRAAETRWGSGAAGRLDTDPIARAIVEKRCARMAEAINGATAKSGVPAIRVTYATNLPAGAGGVFDMKTWTITFPWETLAKDLDAGGTAWLQTAVFHEGTHADQWWNVARMMASDGKDAATISVTIGMKPSVANEAVIAAKRNPLRLTSAEAAPYRDIYLSISNKKIFDRNRVLTEYHAAAGARNTADTTFKTAERELKDAEAAWRAQQGQPPSQARSDAWQNYQTKMANWNRDKQAFDAADRSYQPKLQAYLDLPEERSARAAQAALHKAGGPAP